MKLVAFHKIQLVQGEVYAVLIVRPATHPWKIVDTLVHVKIAFSSYGKTKIQNSPNTSKVAHRGYKYMHFESYLIKSKHPHLPLTGVSEEFKKSFYSLVKNHWNLFIWPNNNIHKVILGKLASTKPAIAYHYYYLNESKDHCEIFAVYVEPEFRSNELAFTLIKQGISEAIQLGANKFTIRFISKNAANGRLVANLKMMAINEYPESLFTFYMAGTIWKSKDKHT